MSEIEITWEVQKGGYIGWNGAQKVCVLGTAHDQGLTRNNVVIYEAQPADQWGIHFTAPSMSVELLKAIIASLPTEAMPKQD